MCAAGIHLKDGTVCKPASLEVIEYYTDSGREKEPAAEVEHGCSNLLLGTTRVLRTVPHTDIAQSSGHDPDPTPSAAAAPAAHLFDGGAGGAGGAGSGATGLNAKVPVPAVVRLTIVEGQYHQVKRMIGACGGYVVKLHREAIGSVTHNSPQSLVFRQLASTGGVSGERVSDDSTMTHSLRFFG